MTAMTEPIQEEAAGSAEPDQSMREKQLLHDITSQVSNRIDRKPGPFEVRALGFLIAHHSYEGTAENFLTTVCGVDKEGTEDSSRDVDVKILGAVSDAVGKEYESRLAKEGRSERDEYALGLLARFHRASVVPLKERLQRVNDNPSEEVHFSGVPGEWIPQWVPAASL